jgi:hypothetical protein
MPIKLLTVGYLFGLFLIMPQMADISKNVFCLEDSLLDPINQNIPTHICSLACTIFLHCRQRVFVCGMPINKK